MKTLIGLLALTFCLCFFSQAISAQEMSEKKVANYSFGTKGKSNYEHFSFWTDEGERTEIYYSYGKDRKEIKLEYLGVKTITGSSGFQVKFPNNLVLFISPTQKHIRIINPRGKYNKTFKWEYEGPVNGIGTFCSVCAVDATDAMTMLANGYL